MFRVSPEYAGQWRSGPPSKHHIARTCVVYAARIGPVRANDHIGKAVAVHIRGAGSRRAAPVMSGHAVEPETIAAIKRRQREFRGKTRCLPSSLPAKD